MNGFLRIVGYWLFVLLCLMKLANSASADEVSQLIAKDKLPELSSVEKIELARSDAGERGQEALRQLTIDATAVLANFDVLTQAARDEAGPRIVARMAEAIRETPPGGKKREAVDRMFNYLQDVLKNGHPSISSTDAVRLVGQTIYYRNYGSVLPSYGTAKARAILEEVIGSKDYATQAEAADWLYRVVITEPSLVSQVLAVCQKHYVPVEKLEDRDAQQYMRRIGYVIDALERRDWRDVGMGIISEEEFVSVKQLSRDQLFDVIPRGGDRAEYAYDVLLKDGCSEATMDRMLDIARKTKPFSTVVVDHVASALIRPAKEGRATAEDIRLLDHFVDIMSSEVDAPDSKLHDAAVRAMGHIIDVYERKEEEVARRSYAPASQKAIEVLMKAACQGDLRARQSAIGKLSVITRVDRSKTEQILQVFRNARENALSLPSSDEKDRLIRQLDVEIKRVISQTQGENWGQ